MSTVGGLVGSGTMRRRTGDALSAYAMLAPAFVILTIFVITALVGAIYLSFFKWGFYLSPVWVGLQNFYLVVIDKMFWSSILVGVEYTLAVIPVQLILAFVIASAIKKTRHLAGLFKTVIYIPTVVSGVIASMIFIFIYSFKGGLLNELLGLFGIKAQAWTANPRLAILAIAVPGIWLGLGVTTLIMLAGLNDIPSDYYEAAALDGASAIKQTVFITIPCLKNVFVYLFVTGIVGCMNMFDLAYFITGGGPLNRTDMPVVHVFNHFANDPTIAYALSAGLLLFAMLGVLSIVIFRVISSEKAIDT